MCRRSVEQIFSLSILRLISMPPAGVIQLQSSNVSAPPHSSNNFWLVPLWILQFPPSSCESVYLPITVRAWYRDTDTGPYTPVVCGRRRTATVMVMAYTRRTSYDWKQNINQIPGFTTVPHVAGYITLHSHTGFPAFVVTSLIGS